MKGETVFFPAGTVIYQDKTMEMFMYELCAGQVGIYLNYGTQAQTLFTDVSAGRCFGEMGLLEVFPRTGTAVALTDAVALRIDSDSLSEYIREDPEKMIAILKTMASRLRDIQTEYLKLRRRAAELTQAEEEKEGILKKLMSLKDLFSGSNLKQGGHPGGKAKKNTVIFRSGSMENWMYFIRCGSVGIYHAYGTGEEKLLAKLSPQSYFGEVGLLEHTARTLTAVALEDSILDRIDEDNLADYLKASPAKIFAILQSISFRLRNFLKDYGEANAAVTEAEKMIGQGQPVSGELNSRLLKIVRKGK